LETKSNWLFAVGSTELPRLYVQQITEPVVMGGQKCGCGGVKEPVLKMTREGRVPVNRISVYASYCTQISEYWTNSNFISLLFTTPYLGHHLKA
jgi:hypothetical protein